MYRFMLSLILFYSLFSASNAFSEQMLAVRGDILQYSLVRAPVFVKASHALNPGVSHECAVMPGDYFTVIKFEWTIRGFFGLDYNIVLEKSDGMEGTEEICAKGSLIRSVDAECETATSTEGLPLRKCYIDFPLSFG